MDEHNILDAPEGEDTSLKIPIKVVLFTILGLSGIYSIYFHQHFFGSFPASNIEFWIFKVDLKQLVFLAITNFGLYLFISFIKFELSHWFRVMTVSVTIVLVATFFSVFIALSPSVVELTKVLKGVVFIALIAGGGCSLAAQFLHKKHYFIFSAVMICTIVFFSLIENL
jgi:hypothetical protein